MKRFTIESEQVNSFHCNITHDNGVHCRYVDFDYQSPFFKEIVQVKFVEGPCGKEHVYFESESGNLNMDLEPDVLIFDNFDVRARFRFGALWIVFEFEYYSLYTPAYFTIYIEGLE